jgi:hypothetical protein
MSTESPSLRVRMAGEFEQWWQRNGQYFLRPDQDQKARARWIWEQCVSLAEGHVERLTPWQPIDSLRRPRA